MKGSYLQIILILALFILPEIFKIFRSKNKKYEYPDEKKYESNRNNSDLETSEYQLPQQEELPTDFWDVLSGRANYQEQEEKPVKVEETMSEPARREKTESDVPTISAPNMQNRRTKLSGKSAAKGLIWAEVLGKPRALRPLENELPSRKRC